MHGPFAYLVTLNNNNNKSPGTYSTWKKNKGTNTTKHAGYLHDDVLDLFLRYAEEEKSKRNHQSCTVEWIKCKKLNITNS